VCARQGVDLPQVALALPAAHPAVATVVVGAHNAEQVSANVACAGTKVPAALGAELIAEGLLPDTPGCQRPERLRS
jgi:D-threo-aldose 1-dehydrogenase